MLRIGLGTTLVFIAVSGFFFRHGDRAPTGSDRLLSLVLFAAGVSLLVWAIAELRNPPVCPVRSWRIARAVADLRNRSITPAAQLQYLLAFLSMEIFSWGADTQVFGFGWNDDAVYSAPIGIAIVVAKLAGPVVCFVANGGPRGADFLDRFFVLSLPVRVRTLALLGASYFPARFVAGFLRAFFKLRSPYVFGGVGAGLFWLSFNVIHYLWLAQLMRANSPKASEQP